MSYILRQYPLYNDNTFEWHTETTPVVTDSKYFLSYIQQQYILSYTDITLLQWHNSCYGVTSQTLHVTVIYHTRLRQPGTLRRGWDGWTTSVGQETQAGRQPVLTVTSTRNCTTASVGQKTNRPGGCSSLSRSPRKAGQVGYGRRQKPAGRLQFTVMSTKEGWTGRVRQETKSRLQPAQHPVTSTHTPRPAASSPSTVPVAKDNVNNHPESYQTPGPNTTTGRERRNHDLWGTESSSKFQKHKTTVRGDQRSCRGRTFSVLHSDVSTTDEAAEGGRCRPPRCSSDTSDEGLLHLISTPSLASFSFRRIFLQAAVHYASGHWLQDFFFFNVFLSISTYSSRYHNQN